MFLLSYCGLYDQEMSDYFVLLFLSVTIPGLPEPLSHALSGEIRSVFVEISRFVAESSTFFVET